MLRFTPFLPITVSFLLSHGFLYSLPQSPRTYLEHIRIHADTLISIKHLIQNPPWTLNYSHLPCS